MKRFVVISDLHVHPWAVFASGTGIENSRLHNTLVVLRASLKQARALDCSWCFAGDLVHTAGHSLNVVSSLLTEVLSEFPEVPKIMVWGNHDARSAGGKIVLEETVLAAIMRAVPNTYVLDGPANAYRDHNGVTYVGYGYQPRGVAFDWPSMRPGYDLVDVGLFHQTVRGSVSPAGFELPEGIAAEKIMEHFRVGVVGHVHLPQQFGGRPGRLVLVPGAPEQQNFGDAGDRGWWVITIPDLPNDPPVTWFERGGSPEFRTVESVRDVKLDGNYYRVRGSLLPGETLPVNANVIASSRSIVPQRDVAVGRGADPLKVIKAWTATGIPAGLSHDDIVATGRSLIELEEVATLRPWVAHSVHLVNFCSYENQRFDIGAGVRLIVGRGRDYPSNGAGKTTLFEALYWLLFGKTTKGVAADEVVRWGERECAVTAEFGLDETMLTVTRSRTKAGGTTLSVTEVAADQPEPVVWETAFVSDMTKELTARLGITADLFQALGYFSQERLVLFASATDSERKNMLADLAGLTAYQAAAVNAAGIAKDRSANADKAHATRSGVQESEQRWKERLDVVRDQSGDWVRDRDVKVASLREELDKGRALSLWWDEAVEVLKVRIAANRQRRVVGAERWAERIADRHDAEAEADLRSRMAKLVADKQEIDAGLEELGDFQASSVDDADQHVRRLTEVLVTQREQVARLQQSRTMLNRTYAGAMTELGIHTAALTAGTCPTCGQEIFSTHRDACLSAAQSNVDAALAAVREAEQAEREASAVLEGVKDEVAAATNERATVKSRAVRASALKVWVGTHEGQVVQARREKELLAAGRVERIRTAREARLRRVDGIHTLVLQRTVGRRGDAKAVVSELERDLTATLAVENPHRKAIEELESALLTDGLRIVELDEVVELELRAEAMYDYWATGFGKRGVQSLLMEEVAAAFNATRSDVFPILTQGVYDVQFSTISHTRSGEARERTEFVVTENGNEIPYAALSGGQRRRVDVGVMLTLVMAVSRWAGVPGMLGMLVLDEVFGFLDESGAEGLSEALRLVQEVVPSVNVITHDHAFAALIPDVVSVVQGDDGVSRIVDSGEQEA